MLSRDHHHSKPAVNSVANIDIIVPKKLSAQWHQVTQHNLVHSRPVLYVPKDVFGH